MKTRTHTEQAIMLGHGVKERASSTSRSSKVNDRLRRTQKRAERQVMKEHIKNGHYNRLLP